MNQKEERWWKPWAIAFLPGVFILIVEQSGLLKAISPWLAEAAGTQVPMPAWLVLALGIYGIVISVAYWNATSAARSRLRLLRAQGKGSYHRPTELAQWIISVMRYVDAPVPRELVIRWVQERRKAEGQVVAQRDIEIVFEDLIEAEWLDTTYNSRSQDPSYHLSRYAVEFCLRVGIKTKDQLPKPDP